MFDWFFGKKNKELEEKTQKGFENVKNDIDKVSRWIKHLDSKDKQLFALLDELKNDLSSLKSEIGALNEGAALAEIGVKHKQLAKRTAVLDKQTAVYPVGEGVQTPVQTGNLYNILQNLTSNERLLIFALLNAGEGMKLSYEDLARLLGKERSTIRGQINTIKQKSEGLIMELTEPSGKKRVFVSEEVRNKLLKYAKVRVRKSDTIEEKPEKVRKKDKKEAKVSITQDSKEEGAENE